MGIELNGITGDITTPGDVGIGGTLTYEDVANVDSVGIITARTGVIVGSGVTLNATGVIATGVVTATTFSGALAASNLTGALPAISGANLTSLPAANLTGTLPAISGANLTGITGTTINTNADNRIITGSGTANTLNGEANATFNGQKLAIGPVDGGSDVVLSARSSNSGGYGAYIQGGSGTNYILRLDDKDQNAMFRFQADGKFGVGTGTPTDKLDVNGTAIIRSNLYLSNNTYLASNKGIYFDGGTGAANHLDDYEEGSFSLQPVNGWGILNGGALNPANAEISQGKYVRIGAIVYIYCTYKEGSSSGASFNGNRILFYGLPYQADTNASNTSNDMHPLFAVGYNLSSNGDGVYMLPSTSGVVSASMFSKTSGGRSDFTGSQLGNSGQLWISGTYRINGT